MQVIFFFQFEMCLYWDLNPEHLALILLILRLKVLNDIKANTIYKDNHLLIILSSGLLLETTLKTELQVKEPQ